MDEPILHEVLRRATELQLSTPTAPARPRPGFHLRAERRPVDRRGRGDRLLEGVRRPRVGVFGPAARSWTKCWGSVAGRHPGGLAARPARPLAAAPDQQWG